MGFGSRANPCKPDSLVSRVGKNYAHIYPGYLSPAYLTRGLIGFEPG